MADRDLDELFAKTLVGDNDDDEPWGAVHDLRGLGTREVFQKAAAWCGSEDPLKRTRGAEVLAQLGKTAENPNTLFADESFEIIATLLQKEADPRPMASAIAALGHLAQTPAVPIIASFRSHTSAEVRFDVAFALGCFPNDPQSIPALIELMRDSDCDVRDWATFGLGVLGEADSDEIRAALVRNLKDRHQDTREEAIAGLAIRKDLRALRPLLKELKRPPASFAVKEAACSLLGLGWEESEREESALIAELKQRFAEHL